MIRYCPNCGEGLDKVANFCPNCGYKIKENQIGSVPSEKSLKGKSIICEVCGEENLPGTAICTSCGAKLKNLSYYLKQSPARTERKERFKENKPGEQNYRTPAKVQAKLGNTKIVTIIVASAAVVFFILLLSGVFDSEPKLNSQSQTIGQNQSSQVNLQNVQRINELENQLKSNPNNADVLLELAHLRNDSGFNEKAIENYKQYLKIHPENADARVDMGVCYYKLRMYDEAKEAMETALKYSPRHQIAHLNLGIVNLAAGNLEKSKEWLQKAVDIDPNSDYGQEAKKLLESHIQQ
ncbi:MAG TPA: tetratricopeptide repeat protein [Ignavibacteriaceae bacterium]|nr:tetratricopeptide repeat protein [Ignavibacteriaceae bacterium]